MLPFIAGIILLVAIFMAAVFCVWGIVDNIAEIVYDIRKGYGLCPDNVGIIIVCLVGLADCILSGGLVWRYLIFIALMRHLKL
mgnify:CR=1 FL=1